MSKHNDGMEELFNMFSDLMGGVNPVSDDHKDSKKQNEGEFKSALNEDVVKEFREVKTAFDKFREVMDKDMVSRLDKSEPMGNNVKAHLQFMFFSDFSNEVSKYIGMMNDLCKNDKEVEKLIDSLCEDMTAEELEHKLLLKQLSDLLGSL